MEIQFKESLQRNSQLAEELGAAKKEIELLKGKLKELEVRGHLVRGGGGGNNLKHIDRWE